MSDQREPAWLSPEELALRWRGVFTLKTLANWRSSQGGPRFFRMRGRVLYRLEDVEAFERRKGIESEDARRAGDGSPREMGDAGP